MRICQLRSGPGHHRGHHHQCLPNAWEWLRSGLLWHLCRFPRVRAANAQPPSAPVHTPWEGAASAQQKPAPVPVPWRSSAEQLPPPPPAHSPVQRLKSQRVLPSQSRRLKRRKDVLGLGWWTTCGRDLPSRGRRSGCAGNLPGPRVACCPDQPHFHQTQLWQKTLPTCSSYLPFARANQSEES